MAKPTPALKIDLDRARAHWHLRQGLAEPLEGSIEEVVAATGWPRTLGGVDVYFAVRARVPAMRRADLDRAVEQSRLQVIPAVRGCIYLVPRPEVPLVLRVAEEMQRKRSERELEKVGVKASEIEDIGKAVLAALKKGPLTTDAIRKALPEGTVRSLGEKGKKLGMSSPLPTAMRELEFEGLIERTLEGGRLDSERYLWRIPKKSPFTGVKVPDEPVERYARIAEIFFRHSGPATAKDFASWTALSQRDALAAIERAGLVPITVEGYAEDCFVHEEDVAVLRKAAPRATSVSMLAFEDGYLVHHGGPAHMVDPKHHKKDIEVWGSTKGSMFGDAKHIQIRTVLDGDRVAGIWELDPDKGEIVFATFDPLPPKRRSAVRKLADELAAFIKEELGHARSFNLDTTEEIKRRASVVRAM